MPVVLLPVFVIFNIYHSGPQISTHFVSIPVQLIQYPLVIAPVLIPVPTPCASVNLPYTKSVITCPLAIVGMVQVIVDPLMLGWMGLPQYSEFITV